MDSNVVLLMSEQNMYADVDKNEEGNDRRDNMLKCICLIYTILT